MALAIALGRAMWKPPARIVSTDIRMTVALAFALAVTGLAASYLPARRAAAVDPIVALAGVIEGHLAQLDSESGI